MAHRAGLQDEKVRVAIQNVTALGLWLPDDCITVSVFYLDQIASRVRP